MFDSWTRREIKLLFGVIGCVVLLIGTLFYYSIFTGQSAEAQNEIPLENVAEEGLLAETAGTGNPPSQDGPTIAENSEIIVDIKGAVKKPGIFHLPPDARVYQAIEAAGGKTDEADTSHLNLADFLTDGMAIIVPKQGEDTGVWTELPSTGGALGGSGGTNGVVNINRATEAELQTLSGIGPARAQAIVQERVEHGPFQSVDDLTRVSGIGEKMLDNIRDSITVK